MNNNKRTMNNEQPSARVLYRKGDDIADRLLELAARIIRFVNALPRSTAGRHIAGQLLRCGTSPGAHFEEARAAESRSDFVHKIALALKELRESHYWQRLVVRSGMMPQTRLDALISETDQLCRILGKSKTTARSRPEAR